MIEILGGPYVVAVNRKKRLLLLDNNDVIKIDTMFDMWSEETDDPDEAISCVAELPDGSWLSVDLRDFEEVSVP